MKTKTCRYFVGDFETTVYEGQEMTEVWASALVEFGTEDVHIFHSIGETLTALDGIPGNLVIYYHNLKFDGEFWLSYLRDQTNYTEALDGDVFMSDQDMPNRSYKYTISDMGMWYQITIRNHKRTIELRDSLKLLPFSVKVLGDQFKTKHRKLEMEYEGYRYAGCDISEEEQTYIANDVLVVKEALEIMFAEGHKKLTIGSCCLAEFHQLTTNEDYKQMFPNLEEHEIEEDLYGYENADQYIRRSYRGGWCYVVPEKAGRIYRNTKGTTGDVNSLYPSMMSLMSHNEFPVGPPRFWKGNYIPEYIQHPGYYYFIRVQTRFYLKPGKLPCIQIKNSFLYRSTEWLETSDLWDPVQQEYCSSYITPYGNVEEARPIMTWTQTDFELIREQYDLVDFEILDGCYCFAQEGVFERYIKKYKDKKLNAKTKAERTLAKLFLNNLYGKMAASSNSSYKIAVEDEDGAIRFRDVIAFDKKPGYIAAGSAITSYARCFTIRAAQANYYGPDKPGFIYADTDSIHCDLPPEEIKGIQVDEKEFCCWKLESYWDEAVFTRQKTYIEHVTHEDGEAVEPYYNIKCAGMPARCKELLNWSLTTVPEEKYEKMNETEKAFVSTKRTLEDFTRGLIVPSKLLPKHVPGGVVLTSTTFEMR